MNRAGIWNCCIGMIGIVVVANLAAGQVEKQKPIESSRLDQQQASRFAQLALKNIVREYPNKLEHVLNGDADVRSPRTLHPAFYGSYDWHSSVHGHWMLVRLLRTFPDLPEGKTIRETLHKHLSAENIQTEVAYFNGAGRQSYERMYGWAWLLKLAEELHTWDDPDAKLWGRNLQLLTELIINRYIAFLPKQGYPIRSGVHPNTAFGLTFAWDYAIAVRHVALGEAIEERSRAYFGPDKAIPAEWEPSGADFLSPSLAEADLMRRVLKDKEFPKWFHEFLPDAGKSEPMSLFLPARVTDRSDPQLVHLDGLNLSRAWCMNSIAAALPPKHPARLALLNSAKLHTDAALKHVFSSQYSGEHWLASFAVYLLTPPNKP